MDGAAIATLQVQLSIAYRVGVETTTRLVDEEIQKVVDAAVWPTLDGRSSQNGERQRQERRNIPRIGRKNLMMIYSLTKCTVKRQGKILVNSS